MKKKIIVVISTFLLLFLVGIFYFKNLKKENKTEVKQVETEEISPSSNIIENVVYSSKDNRGNEYIIRAKQGEIDVNMNEIIFLKNVSAIIILKNSKRIIISADFGKYNINNFDTIFSKNVIIDYQKKNISSDYLDFSILRNSMLISKNVIYSDDKNLLETDAIEINIEDKDIRFFMHKKKDKVKIINKN